MTSSSTITGNATSTIAEVADRAHDRAHQVADRAHQAVDRAADRAAPAVERARAGAHTTIDRVADGAASGVNWAAENSRHLARKSSELSQAAGGYVRERPLVAVAGAFALGFLIGRIVR